jgi:hypothetical protein
LGFVQVDNLIVHEIVFVVNPVVEFFFAEEVDGEAIIA